MIPVPAMLLIGGNARNAGKTTLACHIIEQFAPYYPVIGLKVTSIRPNEDTMHGKHINDSVSSYAIYEETEQNQAKDTSKMLQSGASRVYFMESMDQFLEPAMEKFLKIAGSKALIVCESRSLRKIVLPGVFIMMIRTDAGNNAKSGFNYNSLADEVVTEAGNPDIIIKITENIRIIKGEWYYKK